MIKVKIKFSKGGNVYRKGSKASFCEFDEKRLVNDGFAEYIKEDKE